jgi:Fe-S cluster biosynthesis and repair protein YggX
MPPITLLHGVMKMAEISARIEQFRKMAEADPDNELGHFSLGRAYFDAEMMPEAVVSFDRVVQLNPKLSKVYQLMASALLKLNRRDEAIEQLTAGVKMADQRGDLMPKNEMIRMLNDLGAPVPELKNAAADRAPTDGEVLCHRCGKVKPKMAHPPFSNAQGKMLQEKICADCWREWIGMGTKVINELRLPLSDPRAQKEFDRHMYEFLNLKE